MCRNWPHPWENVCGRFHFGGRAGPRRHPDAQPRPLERDERLARGARRASIARLEEMCDRAHRYMRRKSQRSLVGVVYRPHFKESREHDDQDKAEINTCARKAAHKDAKRKK